MSMAEKSDRFGSLARATVATLLFILTSGIRKAADACVLLITSNGRLIHQRCIFPSTRLAAIHIDSARRNVVAARPWWNTLAFDPAGLDNDECSSV